MENSKNYFRHCNYKKIEVLQRKKDTVFTVQLKW